jgi:quercetin dioxygenase-like cupin family protein
VSDGFDVVRLDELDRIEVGERGLEWRPIRRPLGIRAFGTNAYSSSHVGGEIVEEHSEQQLGHEEMYVVVRGHATFRLDGADVDAPAGTLVFIRDPAVRRAATAKEPDTLVLAVGGKPGEPFTPSAWESSFTAAPLVKAGRFDEAIASMLRDAEQQPDHPGLLYNLACYEALGGRLDDAVEHVARAADLDERFREYARTDEDFAALRGDPRFNAVLERPSA